jgi:hypothetical protein
MSDLTTLALLDELSESAGEHDRERVDTVRARVMQAGNDIREIAQELDETEPDDWEASIEHAVERLRKLAPGGEPSA